MSKIKKIVKQFDSSCHDYNMRNGKLSCGFNMPDAVKGDGLNGLPPYAKRTPFLVDEYPACPDNWMRSEGRLKSFFVPVEEGKGMWIDLNENSHHTHHIAAVISIQGVNPITGLPCNDAQLEQYIDECPKHKVAFGPDRFCKKCEYKWPKQNYISTTGTPSGQLWLDGFRSVDGVVRQYVLTAEKMKGVASNVIGDKRVFAIGISFFLSKIKKPEAPNMGMLRGMSSGTSSSGISYLGGGAPDLIMGNWDQDMPMVGTCLDSMGSMDMDSLEVSCSGLTEGSNSVDTNDDVPTNSFKKSVSFSGSTKSFTASTNKSPLLETPHVLARKRKGTDRRLGSSKPMVQTKKLEVGKGAKIGQSVYDDPERLDFWHDKPESIICINYCAEVDAEQIIGNGKVDINGHEEGFLKDIPACN